MAVEEETGYRRLASVASDCRRFGANLMVVGLSGMGASFYLKTWAKNEGVDYVTVAPEKKEGVVVVDMPENSWKEWEEIYRATPRDQKLIMVVGVEKIGEESVAKNWVLGHVYKTLYLEVSSEKDIGLLANRLGLKVSSVDLSKFYGLSGGIAKLAKCLMVNGGRVVEEVEQMAGLILAEARRAREEDLEKLGVVKNGKYVSAILADLDKKMPDGLRVEVKFDLELVEDGGSGGVKVTADEKKIILEMMANNGMITKEKIAEIKWGEGSYDKFSDQAITMAMRRLDKKFKGYQIETVPRVGYQLKAGGQ
jgi:hypothetical protein